MRGITSGMVVDRPFKLGIFDTVELGDLLDALRAIRNQRAEVRFDFAGFAPAQFHSYRGFYEHVAITPAHRTSPVEVRDCVTALEAVLRDGVHGYKGGHYRVDRRTPVWVSERDRVDETTIVGLAWQTHEGEDGDVIRIRTGWSPT